MPIPASRATANPLPSAAACVKIIFCNKIIFFQQDYLFLHLELTLLDGQLTEEPVHYVAGQEKDIGVAVLVHTHLHIAQIRYVMVHK